MGLWLEHRNEEGKLVGSVCFFLGEVDLGTCRFTVEQARQLCRFSTHLPLEGRDWALRVLTTEEELDRPVLRIDAA